MKIIAGDEFGLLKCVDTSKKIVETKYGEMAKNNSVVAIDSLYTNKNNIISVLHQYKYNVIDWSKQEVVSEPELSVDFLKNKNVEFNSMIVIKNDTDNPIVCFGRSDSKIDIIQYDSDYKIITNNNYELPNKNLQIIKEYNNNEFICLFQDTPMQVINLYIYIISLNPNFYFLYI